MERETAIEPATSSLGSCSLPFGQRQINGLQRAEWGRVRHCGHQLNTILNKNQRATVTQYVSALRRRSSSSIFLRSWVTGTSFFRDPTYLKPSTTADPRIRGSVRRASGFVQIPIARVILLGPDREYYRLFMSVRSGESAGSCLNLLTKSATVIAM